MQVPFRSKRVLGGVRSVSVHRKTNREEGYITVFMTLSFLCLMLACFTVIEGVHSFMTSSLAEEEVIYVGEDILSNYDKGLFNRYHVFFLDPRESEKIEKDGGNAFAQDVNNLASFHMNCGQIHVTARKSAVDKDGKYLMQEIREYMKYEQTDKAIKSLKKLALITSNSADSAKHSEKSLQSSEKAEEKSRIETEKKRKKAEEAAKSGEGDSQSQEEVKDPNAADNPQKVKWRNFLNEVQRVKKDGMLSYFLEDSQISQKKLTSGNLPSAGKVKGSDSIKDFSMRFSSVSDTSQFLSMKNEGNRLRNAVNTSQNEMFLMQYISEHFSSLTETMTEYNHVLRYEKEYMLSGRKSDKDNLKYVANRLLLLRFLGNYAFACSDAGVRKDAAANAALIAGFLTMPELTEAVEMIIITALVFTQSMLDVHALMNGETIPAMHSSSTWNLTFANFLEKFVNKSSVKKGSQNVGYDDYLKLLLFTKTQKTRLYRMMDIMQGNTAQKEPGFLMKNSLFAFRWNVSVECRRYYSSFSVFGNSLTNQFTVNVSRWNSY